MFKLGNSIVSLLPLLKLTLKFLTQFSICKFLFLFLLWFAISIVIANKNPLIRWYFSILRRIIQHVVHRIKCHVIFSPDLFEPIVLSIIDNADNVHLALVRDLCKLFMQSLKSPVFVQCHVLPILFRLLCLNCDLSIHLSWPLHHSFLNPMHSLKYLIEASHQINSIFTNYCLK